VHAALPSTTPAADRLDDRSEVGQASSRGRRGRVMARKLHYRRRPRRRHRICSRPDSRSAVNSPPRHDHDKIPRAVARRSAAHSATRSGTTRSQLSPQKHYKGKASPYSIAERRVPELIPVPGSQTADDEEFLN